METERIAALRLGYMKDTNTLSALIDRAKAQHLADLRMILSFESKTEVDQFIKGILDEHV